MFWHGPGMGGWGFAIMMAGSVLLWAAVIIGIVLLVGFVVRAQRPTVPAPLRAEQLLADRFARGEIDDQEYRTRLDTLRGHPPAVVDQDSADA